MQTDTPGGLKPQDRTPLPATGIADEIGLTVKPIQAAEQRVRVGQEAWSRLTRCQGWTDWLLVAEALDVGRIEAMRSAHTNRAEGRRYNQEFGDWLKANQFDAVHKTTRSQLLKCLKRRAEIEAWRATLTTGERLRLNHPVTVLRRWEKTTVKKPDDAVPKVSHVEKLKASLIESQEENARLKRETEREGPFARVDTARDIAGYVFRKVSPSKAREVARELNRLAKLTEQQGAP